MTVLNDAGDALAGAQPALTIHRGSRVVWSSEAYAQVARELGCVSFQNGTRDTVSDEEWNLGADQTATEGPWPGLLALTGESGTAQATLPHSGSRAQLSATGWTLVDPRFAAADLTNRPVAFPIVPFTAGPSIMRQSGSTGAWSPRGRYMSSYGTVTEYVGPQWMFYHLWINETGGGWAYHYNGSWHSGTRIGAPPDNTDAPAGLFTPGSHAGFAMFPRVLSAAEVTRLFMAREGLGTIPLGADWTWQISNSPPAGVWGVIGGADFRINNTDVDGGDRAAWLSTWQGRRIAVRGDNGVTLTSPEHVNVSVGGSTTDVIGQDGWNRGAFTDAFPPGTILTAVRVPNRVVLRGQTLAADSTLATPKALPLPPEREPGDLLVCVVRLGTSANAHHQEGWTSAGAHSSRDRIMYRVCDGTEPDELTWEHPEAQGLVGCVFAAGEWGQDPDTFIAGTIDVPEPQALLLGARGGHTLTDKSKPDAEWSDPGGNWRGSGVSDQLGFETNWGMLMWAGTARTLNETHPQPNAVPDDGWEHARQTAAAVPFTPYPITGTLSAEQTHLGDAVQGTDVTEYTETVPLGAEDPSRVIVVIAQTTYGSALMEGYLDDIPMVHCWGVRPGLPAAWNPESSMIFALHVPEGAEAEFRIAQPDGTTVAFNDIRVGVLRLTSTAGVPVPVSSYHNSTSAGNVETPRVRASSTMPLWPGGLHVIAGGQQGSGASNLALASLGDGTLEQLWSHSWGRNASNRTAGVLRSGSEVRQGTVALNSSLGNGRHVIHGASFVPGDGWGRAT